MKTKLLFLMLALEISIGVAHGASAFDQMLSSSFKANGIAGLDRLNQDAEMDYRLYDRAPYRLLTFPATLCRGRGIILAAHQAARAYCLIL